MRILGFKIVFLIMAKSFLFLRQIELIIIENAYETNLFFEIHFIEY